MIPFAKSATTGQHCPVRSFRHLGVASINGALKDNTRYAYLQMDDRALVYRGADQPDLSVINPESDVWQHIKVISSSLRRKLYYNDSNDRSPKDTWHSIGLFDIRH